MRILTSFLIGTSYLSLFPARSSDILAKVSPTCSMSQCSRDSPNQDYEPGSSSVAFVTTPDEASAKKIANALVEQKLVACVNIIPQITSIYHWDGKVNEDSEVLMMIKTRTSRVGELTKFVRENHPYSVAEVITLPIQNGNPPYLEWIGKTVLDKK